VLLRRRAGHLSASASGLDPHGASIINWVLSRKSEEPNGPAQGEAQLCQRLAQQLCTGGAVPLEPAELGVICLYKAQAAAVRRRLDAAVQAGAHCLSGVQVPTNTHLIEAPCSPFTSGCQRC
jgi:hypothetical protein